MKYLLCLLTLLFNISTVAAADIPDLKSPIMQEVYYTMYEKKVQSEIIAQMEQRGISSREAQLTMAYLKAQIDMLSVKNNVMACFERKKLNFANPNGDKAALADCFYDYKEQLEIANMKAENNEDVVSGMMIASYFTANKKNAVGDDADKLVAITENVATDLALSRMDVHKLYGDIQNCMSGKNDDIKNMECVVPTEKIFRQEIKKAMEDLIPYVEFFMLIMLNSEGRL